MDASGVPPVRTTCPYCGVGCGVLATKTGKTTLSVEGDPHHPANFGKLCSKGNALGETMGDEGRLLHPSINGHQVSWDRAIDHVALGFKDAIDKHGPDSVAFYVSGQLLTEDYYVANKLMKGFIGSGNIDTNSRLCMASAVAGHKRAFGTDTVPGTYKDFELADLIVLTGSNLAWCHPVLYQRIVAVKAKRPNLKVVVIDPRRTPTCDIADLHLPIRSGADVPLFNGLFNYLYENDCVDQSYVEQYTSGVREVQAHVSGLSIDAVAEMSGVDRAKIAAFYSLFEQTERTVSIFSQGINQASDGTDRVNAIINCHLLTGRIGKPGASPFSITGQPNAMGGREVGGLANQLANHLEVTNPDHRDLVQRYWDAPRMLTEPGLKAVDLFDAVAEGKIKAIWIMATNPVVSMPNADKVRQALKDCPLVVVSDIVKDTDTVACADVLLPSTGWGEKDGTVTNSERRISRQRQVLVPPGEARHDWRQFCDVATAMGWGDAFSFESQADVFREYAAMTAFENEGTRDLDLGGLANITDVDFELMDPVQWPVISGEDVFDEKRFFANGGFYTDDQKARFIVTAKTPSHVDDDGFVLNTGRIRDQWHTMTRTGRSSRLWQHIAEPFVEIHPEDAVRIGVRDADLARVSSEYGDAIVRVVVTDRVRIGDIFVPMHWTGQVSSRGRVDVIVAPEHDPFSGQPALKSTRVELERYKAKWYGYFVGEKVEVPEAAYWAKSKSDVGYRVEAAGKGDVPNEMVVLRHILNVPHGAEIVSMSGGKNRARYAVYVDSKLFGLAFIDRMPVAASRAWLAAQIGQVIDHEDRKVLLAGRPGAGRADPGPIVCSCMNVGTNDILNACKGGAASVDKIGECTGAGTNCGSCRPEIAKLLEAKVDAA